MAATRAQRLREAADLPADCSVVVYAFPDGWTVRRLDRVSDLLREGRLMGNCLEWSDYRHHHRKDDARLRPRGFTNERYFSLRDPDNLPHLTFVMSNWSGKARGHSRLMRDVLGRHNSEPRDTYLKRLYAWAYTLPGVWYHRRGAELMGVPISAAAIGRQPLRAPHRQEFSPDTRRRVGRRQTRPGRASSSDRSLAAAA